MCNIYSPGENRLEQFDRVIGLFKPRNTADLIPGAAAYIGWRFLFQAAWIIEEGPYVGEWALQIVLVSMGAPLPPFAWLAESDVEILTDALNI